MAQAEKSFWENRKAGFIQRYRSFTAPWRALPNFLIIGVQKGGTSSLFYYLSQHPDIETSTKKEIHFFNFDFNRGLNWYKQFFPFQKKGILTGEATPAYIIHPQAPERIKQTCPNVKLIVLFREPLRRAFSNFKMNKREGLEQAHSFEEAVERELKQRDIDRAKVAEDPNYYSREMHHESYIGRSLYYSQLQPWLNEFSSEQLLFLKSEDFFQHPKQELEKVYQFLGVKTLFPVDLKAQFTGNYEPIEKNIEQKFSGLFDEENQQLKTLTGIHWD